MCVPEPLDPTRPYLISVVCLGNICRSPIAAVVLRDRLAAAGLDVRSEQSPSGYRSEQSPSGYRSEQSPSGYRSGPPGAPDWPGVQVESAGTGSWHIGDRMDERAADTLRAAGYDEAQISGHRARAIDRFGFTDRDLVLGMDDANLRTLRELAPRTVREQGRVRLFGSYGDVGPVPDPWFGGPEGFPQVLWLVEKGADTLVAELAELRRRHFSAE